KEVNECKKCDGKCNNGEDKKYCPQDCDGSDDSEGSDGGSDDDGKDDDEPDHPDDGDNGGPSIGGCMIDSDCNPGFTCAFDGTCVKGDVSSGVEICDFWDFWCHVENAFAA
ncbi:hypothetical protein ACFLQO_01685, partial [Candidatus Aenigmatarchaeota archaeon]